MPADTNHNMAIDSIYHFNTYNSFYLCVWRPQTTRKPRQSTALRVSCLALEAYPFTLIPLGRLDAQNIGRPFL
jgi:hypothetical protein